MPLGLFAPDCLVWRIHREHRNPSRAQPLKDRSVLPGTGLHRLHEGLVLPLGIGEDGRLRTGMRSQRLEFARMVHANLKHRKPMRWPNAQ